MRVGTKCIVCQKPLGPGQYAAQVGFGILEDFGGVLDFDDALEAQSEALVCGKCFKHVTLASLFKKAPVKERT